MHSFYTYVDLERDLKSLREKHPTLSVFSIGKSLQGRSLHGIKLGHGNIRILFHGAHHGMESITSALLMTFAKELVDGLYDAKTLLGRTSLYLIPMVNPDGVEIAATGKPWQANARGVDLNHNYDALWHLSKQAEAEYGIQGAGPTRFSGAYPESEPESHALATFTRWNSFDLALAFHSQGEVIYWDFCGYAPENALSFGKRLEAVSCFSLDTPDVIASYGGYKDWFIRTFQRPAFTIEVGLGENPLPLSDLPTTYQRTLPLLLESLRLL